MNQFLNRKARHSLLVICLAMVTASLLSDETAKIRIGSVGDPQTLDPHRYSLNVEEHILKDLFLGLTTMDAKGNIVPGSANSWDVSEDGLTWTFHLRENHWSDGIPVKASDFVYGFRRLMDPQTASPLAFFLYVIRNGREVNSGSEEPHELGVEAVNDSTLVLHLDKPFPYLPERLFYPTGYPVPAHVIEKVGSDWVRPEHWVSNGAYVLEDWKPQQAVVLSRNEHFYDRKNVAINNVDYVPVTETLAGYHRYLANELDIIGDFPSGEIENLRKTHPEHVHVSPLLSTMYLVFNVMKPPFDDVKVREALALALDRTLLTSQILRSGETPNASMVPSMVPGFTTDVKNKTPDQERAMDLLLEAGFSEDNPLELTLRYISGTASKQVHVAIAAMWQEVGVATTLHNTELKVHFTDLHGGDFEVAQAGWFGENNPEHYIELLWSKIGGMNYGRYTSEAFDELIELAKDTVDPDTRAEVLKRAENEGLKEYPVIPLYSVTIRSLVSPKISGWYTNPRNSHGVRYMKLH